VLAHLVQAYFYRFPVEDAVATVDPLPHTDGAQLSCGDGRLRAEAIQVLIRNEPGTAATRGVSCRADLKLVCRAREHAFLAVESILSPHEDEWGRP
jgi:hypothetical protein